MTTPSKPRELFAVFYKPNGIEHLVRVERGPTLLQLDGKIDYEIQFIEKSAFDKAVAALKRINELDSDPYNHHKDAKKCAICMARETLREIGVE